MPQSQTINGNPAEANKAESYPGSGVIGTGIKHYQKILVEPESKIDTKLLKESIEGKSEDVRGRANHSHMSTTIVNAKSSPSATTDKRSQQEIRSDELVQNLEQSLFLITEM